MNFLCSALPEKEGSGQPIVLSDLALRLPFAPSKERNPALISQQMPCITSLFLLTSMFQFLKVQHQYIKEYGVLLSGLGCFGDPSITRLLLRWAVSVVRPRRPSEHWEPASERKGHLEVFIASRWSFRQKCLSTGERQFFRLCQLDTNAL